MNLQFDMLLQGMGAKPAGKINSALNNSNPNAVSDDFFSHFKNFMNSSGKIEASEKPVIPEEPVEAEPTLENSPELEELKEKIKEELPEDEKGKVSEENLIGLLELFKNLDKEKLKEITEGMDPEIKELVNELHQMLSEGVAFDDVVNYLNEVLENEGGEEILESLIESLSIVQNLGKENPKQPVTPQETEIPKEEISSLKKESLEKQELNSQHEENKETDSKQKRSDNKELNHTNSINNTSTENQMVGSKNNVLFVDQIKEVSQAEEPKPAPYISEEVQKNILEQLKTGLVSVLKSSENSISIQLLPEHLGKVEITMDIKSDVFKGNILVENDAVKHVVESQMNQLRENLESQNLKVEQLNVDVNQNKNFFSQERVWEERIFNHGGYVKNSKNEIMTEHIDEQSPGSDTGRRWGYNTLELIA